MPPLSEIIPVNSVFKGWKWLVQYIMTYLNDSKIIPYIPSSRLPPFNSMLIKK